MHCNDGYAWVGLKIWMVMYNDLLKLSSAIKCEHLI